MEKLGSFLDQKYGVGQAMINKICCKFGVNRWLLVSDLQKQDLLLMTKYIEKTCKNKDEDQIYLSKLVEKEFKINSLKGFCFKNGLPVHGQRTKTNGRTAKKKLILNFFKK